jgi:dTDP-3-amino-3,4,6-trideoxy-alpha-D-glucose transaminase
VTAVTVPLFDMRKQLQELRPEIDQRMLSVVDSGRFILGPEVESFEREFADYLGVNHVVAVANGTDAMTIALRALGLERGEEVVVPSFTFYATAEAVVNAGGRPVFCDIDPDTFCITAESVEQALSPKTRAVVPVHLFGMPAPMEELRALVRDRPIALLEDAAQAAGAELGDVRVGALGDAAAFSFFPSKNLFCLGDGGAIATSDDETAQRARLLRRHGSLDKTHYSEIGYNSRLDALQASVLRVGLRHLDDWNAARRMLAQTYREAGLGELVSLPAAAPGAEPVYHLYVVRSDQRDQLTQVLAEAGIESRACYQVPIHRQPAMAPYAAGAELPRTELAARTNLALPMAPTQDGETARLVVEAVRQAISG